MTIKLSLLSVGLVYSLLLASAVLLSIVVVYTTRLVRGVLSRFLGPSILRSSSETLKTLTSYFGTLPSFVGLSSKVLQSHLNASCYWDPRMATWNCGADLQEMHPGLPATLKEKREVLPKLGSRLRALMQSVLQSMRRPSL